MLPELSHFAAFALDAPRSVKRGVVLVLDVGLCVLSVFLAFYLRIGNFVEFSGPVILTFFVSAMLALPIFITSGLYRAIFRYSGLPAMLAVVQAMLLYCLGFAIIFTFWGVPGVPRTVGLLQPILLLLLVGASRAAARVWLGGVYYQQVRKASLPQALIYGAGSAGRQLASAMVNSVEIRVVGFLDDDDRLHGQVLNGLPIHKPADLALTLAKVHVTDVLLALPSVSRHRRSQILATLSPYELAVRTMPSLSDIASGKVCLSDVRELEIDDLLGRDPVLPSPSMMAKNITGKVVMVTGAGGSIGSELCRQILKAQPSTLLLVELTEFALYEIHRELEACVRKGQFNNDSASSVTLVPLLASVRDAVRMGEILHSWNPNTVYHAAAYKHVPLVEHNPSEGVKNNAYGTLIMALQSALYDVSDFVLVSTDKAVRPTNVMGSSKRLAEMVLQACSEVHAQKGGKTRFSMVRFGNVLGSSGSVVPLFRKQIAAGGPITLTDARITRYFMSLPEAAQLVIQAGAMAIGGDVFVLDMGEPVKIIDLAKRMVELSGLKVLDENHPDGDIEIQVTGLRPGEKLYEELLIGDNPLPTAHPRIMKAHEDFLPWDELHIKLNNLNAALDVNNVPLIRTLLKELVPGYQPDGVVVDWVWMENAKSVLT